MFLEIKAQSATKIQGAILVVIRVKKECRYAARFGEFFFLDNGMAGWISLAGSRYLIYSNESGFFQLAFPTYPAYWNSLVQKPQNRKIEEWVRLRKRPLLMAGRC